MEKSKASTGKYEPPHWEELLGRTPVAPDTGLLRSSIAGKTVLVTGGGGSIGSELCRQIVRFSPERLVILDCYENNAYDVCSLLRLNPGCPELAVEIANIRDRERLQRVFSHYHPALVFHAAAHKHVPLMEHNPDEAVKNNVLGTLNTLCCAEEAGAEKFVFISTDKAVNPTSVMGATKRLGELLVQQHNRSGKTVCAAVRFGNVLGSNGSVVLLFVRQIRAGGPVTLTDRRVSRYFMTVAEAAGLVLQAGAFAAGGEIFVLDMGEPVRIYDLAVKMIRHAGLRPGRDIAIRITGLRPGEKLHEELAMKHEDFAQTEHERIFAVKPGNDLCSLSDDKLSELIKAAGAGDNGRILRMMTELVPNYSVQ